jgi:hypothetical protein
MPLWVMERQGIRALPDIGKLRLEIYQFYPARGSPIQFIRVAGFTNSLGGVSAP